MPLLVEAPVTDEEKRDEPVKVSARRNTCARTPQGWSIMRYLEQHPVDECLDALVGEVPRRVRGVTALWHYGVRNLRFARGGGAYPKPLDVNVAVEVEADRERAEDEGVWLLREDAATLTRWAHPISARTWVSTPERAMLDAAGETVEFPFYLEAIMNAFISGHAGDGARIEQIAAELDAGAELRRLRAAARVIHEYPVDKGSLLPVQYHVLASDHNPDAALQEWIAMDGDLDGPPMPGEERVVDHVNRAIWLEHPDGVLVTTFF